MSVFAFDLYLDESGDFEHDDSNTHLAPSLVGGLIIPSHLAKDTYFDRLIPAGTHAMESYGKANFLKILEQLRADGGHFIIFNNEERLKIVNGDTTYLNILSEGIVKLMRDLRILHEQIDLHIIVATRQAVSYKRDFGHDSTENIRIDQDQYYTRLDEKIILAMGKNRIQGVSWNLCFDSATRNRRLMAADIICNTYLTKNGKRKFTLEDRQQIETLYEKQYIYSVFDNATVGYLNRLFIEERYGEVLYNLCALQTLTGLTTLRVQLFAVLIKANDKVRDSYFNYMSLQIGQHNHGRILIEGIRLAENYKKIILTPFIDYVKNQPDCKNRISICTQIRFWMFDTDFYILTMYDHMGNTAKCIEYLQRCRENIDVINHSWEHIDYYFRFCLRELMSMIGQFRFTEVLEKSEKLLRIFSDAKDLFSLIGAYDGIRQEPKSELLGKVNGIRLQAYTNLLRMHPDLWDNALAASDAAIAEFTHISDLTRQYQYRCLLMVEAGKPQEALDCLLQSCPGSKDTPSPYKLLLDTAYQDPKLPNEFTLLHYTNVLRLLAEVNDSRAKNMASTLLQYRLFAEDIKGESKTVHPWNLICWNLSKYFRALGQHEKAEKMYNQALKITKSHSKEATMYSFAISMTADWVLYCRNKIPKNAVKAEREYQDVRNHFLKMDVPMEMKEWFGDNPDGMSIKDLQKIANKYLK